MELKMFSCDWPCARPSRWFGSTVLDHLKTPPAFADFDVSSGWVTRPLLSCFAVVLVSVLPPEPPLLPPPHAARNAAPSAAPPVRPRARRRFTRPLNTSFQ